MRRASLVTFDVRLELNALGRWMFRWYLAVTEIATLVRDSAQRVGEHIFTCWLCCSIGQTVH